MKSVLYDTCVIFSPILLVPIRRPNINTRPNQSVQILRLIGVGYNRKHILMVGELHIDAVFFKKQFVKRES